MYLNGHGCEVDTEKALKYYQLSAAQGNSSAKYNIGRNVLFFFYILITTIEKMQENAAKEAYLGKFKGEWCFNVPTNSIANNISGTVLNHLANLNYFPS